MVEISGRYLGEKSCELQHPSQSKIITDAPKDNQGRGMAFSPTDLVGAALGSCMLTTMALTADKEGIPMIGATFTLKKEMAASPRRIARLTVMMQMPATIAVEHRERLVAIGEGCPVFKSLHPDLQTVVKWQWV